MQAAQFKLPKRKRQANTFPLRIDITNHTGNIIQGDTFKLVPPCSQY